MRWWRAGPVGDEADPVGKGSLGAVRAAARAKVPECPQCGASGEFTDWSFCTACIGVRAVRPPGWSPFEPDCPSSEEPAGADLPPQVVRGWHLGPCLCSESTVCSNHIVVLAQEVAVPVAPPSRSLVLNCPCCGVEVAFRVLSADVEARAVTLSGGVMGLSARVELSAGHSCGEG